MLKLFRGKTNCINCNKIPWNVILLDVLLRSTSLRVSVRNRCTGKTCRILYRRPVKIGQENLYKLLFYFNPNSLKYIKHIHLNIAAKCIPYTKYTMKYIMTGSTILAWQEYIQDIMKFINASISIYIIKYYCTKATCK